MGKNVAQQLLDILKDVGVKQVFGVTGDALNFFVKAIEEQDQVEWVARNTRATVLLLPLLKVN
jgi:pyruvate dehydrogenase (quinone)